MNLSETEIESFICAISFPASLDEIAELIEMNHEQDIEVILNSNNSDCYDEWTVPRWARIGDVAFFYHTQTAKTKISRLCTELKNKSYWLDEQFTIRMQKQLDKGRKLYSQYGGDIFAVGRVSSNPSFGDSYYEYSHFKSRVFSSISDVFVFEIPIHISEFKEIVKIEQSSVTPLFGKAYEELIELLKTKNSCLPAYLLNTKSVVPNYIGVNQKNWLEINNRNNRKHRYENQFRYFYVNYLLSEFYDDKILYRECECYKTSSKPSYVDNVIKFYGKYLPVEVKLNIDLEADLKGQVRKYSNTSKLLLRPGEIARADCIYNFVLIIDTRGIYIYDYRIDDIIPLIDLDNLQTIGDVRKAKKYIYSYIKE